jgi:hypothetical protein
MSDTSHTEDIDDQVVYLDKIDNADIAVNAPIGNPELLDFIGGINDFNDVSADEIQPGMLSEGSEARAPGTGPDYRVDECFE